jgi:queuine tRNA-ribosyltransferase
VFSFEILKKSEKSTARLGIINTNNGSIETPGFVFCATKANIKGLTVDKIKEAGTQTILSNTYHLMLRPGSEIIKNAGGLHAFTGWNGPMFTDSGGFQIFSLGYGSVSAEIKGVQFLKGQKTLLALEEDGAKFRSYIDGKIITLTPELSMKVQRELGADIIIALDECVPYHVNKLYTANSMEKSKRWALRFLNETKRFGDNNQALLAVIQGGIYKDLRVESARFANENDFHGFAIGGSLGKTKSEMYDIVAVTSEMINKEKYAHLLGVGKIEDIFNGVKCGIDTFDCVMPTRIARHGAAIVKKKELLDKTKSYLNLNNSIFKTDYLPISPSCQCYTCRNFSRAYIHYLLKAKEVLSGGLISIHNIYTINKLMSDIRDALKTDSLENAYKEWLDA